MDSFKTLWFVFAACFLLNFVATEDDDSKTDKYTQWKKDVCENRNRTFNNEMYECWLTEPKAVLEASQDCIERAVPSANGHMVDYLEVACQNKTAYLIYDACIIEYESKEEYRKQMVVSPETRACYIRLFTKYYSKGSPEESTE